MATYTAKIEKGHNSIQKAGIKEQKSEMKGLLIYLGSLYKGGKIRKNTLIKEILDIEQYKLGKKVPFLQILMLTRELRDDKDAVGGSIDEKWVKLVDLLGNL